MFISLVFLPSYDKYCSNKFRVSCIADIMSIKRYESIRRFCDAMAIQQKYKSSTKLFKVEPVVNDVGNNCRKTEQESHQFTDEQIIPVKTKKSGIWQ